MKDVFCAIDLGATSGRIIIAPAGTSVADDDLQVIYRFPNAIYEQNGMFFWNTDSLWLEIQKGLRLLADRKDLHVLSIGVDSWGCDIIFLDSQGQPIAHPRAYRDPYTNGRMEQLWQQLAYAHSADNQYVKDPVSVGRNIVYLKTGIQMLPFNTIYQLYACSQQQYAPFLQAAHYLLIADYFNYLLTGVMRCEYTLLSTSQLLNWYSNESAKITQNTDNSNISQTNSHISQFVSTQSSKTVCPHLDSDLLQACGADLSKFAPMAYPSERIGMLRGEISPFAHEVPVIAVASHDTASAVTTVPDEPIAYLSSGTWSLMGIVSPEPVITQHSFAFNFTNEGGVGQTSRLLKNITGMWILEQCRSEWKKQGKDYPHEQLIQMAQQTDYKIDNGLIKPPQLFNPDDPRFANPVSMLNEVQKDIPQSDNRDALTVWTIYHSLAHRYGEVFHLLQQLAPFTITRLHIIGGGARNAWLNQLTEQAIGVPVTVGSTEATALGNILIQSKAL
ncbi:MAG: rhamnulokinase [Paludibacteraceae bacterium]|nr:rhamnulokinase [Paludibacteraceae bacterium]